MSEILYLQCTVLQPGETKQLEFVDSDRWLCSAYEFRSYQTCENITTVDPLIQRCDFRYMFSLVDYDKKLAGTTQ